jgi:mannose-1-phosphate guanylyltransferase
MQIVINAGGSGTRLWPISTEVLPKQFCALVEEKPMLRVTFDRFLNQYPVDNLWISVNKNHLELVKQQIPELPIDHILVEPERRDTFPAVAAHAAVVAGLTHQDENIIFVPADAHIEDDDSIANLMTAISKIDTALEANLFKVGVIGIKPNFPSTQFGYVEVNEEIKSEVFSQVQKVDSFKEKPNFELATDFYNAGNYLWNFGAFA